ncbi:unnamed protein product, partial [marine sediment metagenome]
MKSKKKVKIITSWDDFKDEDVLVLNLLDKYKLPAIFYIPYNEILNPEKLELARRVAKNYEIGSHTVNHTILTNIHNANLYSEIM